MTKKDKAKELFVLFLAFFKTGFFTVGGGYAMIPIIQRVIVEEKKWLNAYHHSVYKQISPYLCPQEAEWLQKKTKEI